MLSETYRVYSNSKKTHSQHEAGEDCVNKPGVLTDNGNNVKINKIRRDVNGTRIKCEQMFRNVLTEQRKEVNITAEQMFTEQEVTDGSKK